MKKITLGLIILVSQFLYSDVEDHFKKAMNKLEYHQIDNVDFIYMINLDERPEKYELCMKTLNPYGIYPYRFSAVNGWQLSLEALNDLGIHYESWMTAGIMGTYFEDDEHSKHEMIQNPGKTYFCHCMPRGSVGIVLSHLSILQDAYDSQYETIWVMEDDVEVIQDPHVLSDLIEKLDALVGKDSWDILFTDQDTKSQQGNYVPCGSFSSRPNFSPANPARFALKEEISPDFRRIGARYGAYSMIVRRSGMKKILNFIKNYHVFLPFDMEYTLPNNIRLYTVISDVISTQPQALSDNGVPNYKNRIFETIGE